MFKVNNKDTRTNFRRSGVFIVDSEHISHLVLVFLLLTWTMRIGSLLIDTPLHLNTKTFPAF